MDYTLLPTDLIRKLLWYDINADKHGIVPTGNDIMDQYMFEFNNRITYDEIIGDIDRRISSMQSMLGEPLDEI